MSKAVANKDRCQGCRYCIQACPKDAISIDNEINGKGFKPIVIDEEKCIGCGACYVVCPDYVINILEV